MDRSLRRGRLAAWGLVALAVVALPAADDPEGSDPLDRYDAKVTAEDREHWAFQPVGRIVVPSVGDRGWVRNPIDAFVLSGLEAKGWAPSPPAGPRALYRRLCFDLTGLPPSPDEIEAFLANPAPDAINQAIDALLARPEYGERWGRHWLDLARFAETNGYERDAIKPNAWRYRDYVVRALNEDRPFDRFLTEQVAGDELPDASSETMIATSFHRVGPWDDEPADPTQDRFDQLDDLVRTTSEVFLGLTLGCARCHDHKFEPLTTLDYYRMVAIFDPLQRPQDGRTERDLPVGTRAELDALAALDRKLAALRSELDAAKQRMADGQDEEECEEARREIDASEDEIRCLEAERGQWPRAYIFHEPEPTPPITHLLERGQATLPGPEVEPGFPAVLVDAQPTFPEPGPETTGRRLALARWMADPHHPLTARVIVNRVWQAHFGEGIVRTPSDFGTMGDPPTHPELLDWLASWFVDHGWSLKALHRLILTSNTYRMSKQFDPDHAAEDPENRLLWRFPYRRLEAEAIRDAILAVSGQLDRTMGGPSVYPEVPPEALEAHSDPDKIWPPFDPKAADRRTIYATVKRSLVVPMLEVLDFCDTTRSTPRRDVTSVAPQALTLLNGAFVNRQSLAFADRLIREAGDNPGAQIERAYLLALGRPPTPRERKALVRFLDREAGRIDPREEAGREALARACRIVFNLNEFAYPD